VPTLVAQEVHRAAMATPWPADENKRAKKISQTKAALNNAAVAKMTVARLAQVDPAGEVIGWMTAINQRLAQ
jgi:hypothetical protein